MFKRLIDHWVYGGFLAGVLLIILTPLLVGEWPIALIATFLHLPIYMLHQYEEHDHDRFRLFFNQTMGKGHDVLSPLAVFVTNVPGVWGVIALSLYLAHTVALGWALIAVYLVLVNAIVHIVHGIVFRAYNPGLATGIVLFLPLSIFTLHQVHEAVPAGRGFDVIGLISAILIHAAILIHVKRKLHRLPR